MKKDDKTGRKRYKLTKRKKRVRGKRELKRIPPERQ